MITPIRRIAYDKESGELLIEYDIDRYSVTYNNKTGELAVHSFDQNKEHYFYQVDLVNGFFYEIKVKGIKDKHFIEFLNTNNPN